VCCTTPGSEGIARGSSMPSRTKSNDEVVGAQLGLGDEPA
jgi:hypothetical protein